MSLTDEFRGVVGDFLTEPREVEGVVNNLLYYAKQHQKTAFATGLVLGFFAGILILKWLA